MLLTPAFSRAALFVIASLTLPVLPARAQDKPEDKPRVLMCVPLGVLPGQTTKVVARGLRLEGATEVKSGDARVSVKMLSQGKIAVPGNQNAQKVGDQQAEFELVVPADFPAGNLDVVIVTPQGEARYALPVGGEMSAITEKEPNPGFKQSQAITVPQLVIGSIENPNDVDVFAIDTIAGQKIICEVHAQRLGSGLDALLTIYDSAGTIVATHDDLSDSRDARLEFTAAKETYFVALQDANDQGGPAHPYRLSVQVAP